MKSLYLLLMCIFLITGCDGEPGREIDVFQLESHDNHFSNEQIDVIISSFEEICEVTKGDRCPVLEFSTVDDSQESDLYAKKIIKNKASIVGMCSTSKTHKLSVSEVYMIYTITAMSLFRIVFIHEMFHHFNVNHHPGSGDIMEPRTGNVTNFNISQRMLDEMARF